MSNKPHTATRDEYLVEEAQEIEDQKYLEHQGDERNVKVGIACRLILSLFRIRQRRQPVQFGPVALLLPRAAVDVALALDLAIPPLAPEVGAVAADGSSRPLGQLPGRHPFAPGRVTSHAICYFCAP